MDNKIKVDMSSGTWEKCECGGKMFESVYIFKRISPLMSPSGKELHIPLEVFRCKECSNIPKFVWENIPDMPEDMKAIIKKPETGSGSGAAFSEGFLH